MMKEKKAATIVVLIALFLVSLQANYGSELLLDNSAFSLDKGTYSIEEAVQISIVEEYIDTSYLVVSNENNVYKYLSQLKNPTIFNIKEESQHTIRLLTKEDNQLIDLETFEVGQPIEEPEQIEEELVQETPILTGVLLEIEKESYNINEKVMITISGIGAFEESALKLTITTENQSYRYLGISSEITFIPRQQGNYQITLSDTSSLLAQKSFEALPVIHEERLEIVPSSSSSKNNIKIFNSKQDIALGELILEKDDPITDAILNFKDKPIEKIEFRKINTDKEIRLGFEQLSETNYQIKDGYRRPKSIVKAFAIDPTEITFEDAVVTAVAKGNELYKCKDWNFKNQQCFGTWEKLMNIVPGQEYTFVLTQDDPGYVETGLASINTNKSIYHPGESVEIIMVVLDTEGFLVSNAEVTLTITDPNDVSILYSTSGSTISESESGIYRAHYDETSLEGDYDLFVHATGPDVNSNMSSYFLVREFYDYDILRDVPVTIDPWRGPFASSLRVIAYVNVTQFNLTEQIPSDFTVTDTGGAIITEQDNKKYLVWTDLDSNDLVSYRVQAPLRTPELWEIGPAIINSALGDFTEGRPWFLAIDPTGDSKPTAFLDATNVGTNEANAYDTSTTTYASIDVDANANPTYVTYTTFNISSFDNLSTINSFNITYTAITSGSFDVDTPDNWYLEYSVNGGTGWTVCDWGEAEISSKTNYSCAPSFSGWTIQDFADNFQARVGGDKDGGPDRVALYVYDIFATLNYTLPNVEPTPLSWAKNQSSIYVNDSVRFNATWMDLDNNLSYWVFSWNRTGIWKNITNATFTSNNLSTTNQTVNATAGTLIGWMFYANDSDGEWNNTPVQTFTVLGVDTDPPHVENESVSPTTGVSGTIFNLTADVTDDQTVQSVDVIIRMPNGTNITNPMTSGSGDSYYYLYTSQSGGNFSFKVNASDGTNTNISDTWTYFNVTANISTVKTYYARGDTVTITGDGFYAGGSVTIDVLNSAGSSITGYPKSTTADANGDISTTWNISSALTFAVGNYTINATDDTLSWLQNSTEVVVVIKPSSANSHTDGPTGQQDIESLSEVNDSDNTYANIVGSTAEVWLETNFSNVLPAGYIVNSAILYFEHQEISTDDMYVKWYNSTSGLYQTMCTIGNQATETFDSCNLSSVVTDSAALNSLSIHLSDDDGANNNENWTLIDFVYLDITFEVSLDMAITINEPAPDTTTYTPGSNNKAWDGGDTTNPPPPSAILTGTEASNGEYTNLSASDDARFHTLVALNGYHAYQSFKFIVTDSIGDISSLTITHEGFATETTTPDPDSYHIYIWNYTSGGYSEIATPSASASDQTTIITLNGNGTGVINSSGGNEVWILVVGDFRTGGSGNQQADIWTDYMGLRVNKMATISGMQDINATVTDGDGVAACTYYYTYPNGTLAGLIFGMENQSNNIWYNSSNTLDYADGFYYIYVNCTDGGSSQENASIYVRVANTEPTINLVAPVPNANLSYTNINFTWNATEIAEGVLTCNLTIDGVVQQTNVPSTSGQNTTRNVTVSDGFHTWNVTCIDSAGLSNTSTTWNFTVDTIAPTVSLNSPNPDYATNQSTITFYYTPSDANNISNCSLIINGQVNDTNYSITNGSQNSFTVTGFSEGYYNWSVNCTDSFDWTGNSSTRNFTIDMTRPTIITHYPDGDAFSGGTVTFNFTVTDNLDGNLTCNLSIDGVVSATNNNFAALNGSVTEVTETGIDDGNHTWTITCWDDANNTNTSSTKNFSMAGPPTVNLLTPPDQSWTNATFTNFTYYVNDGNGIQNCTFIFDGSFNQSNSSPITNPGNNTFNLSNIPEGLHNWTVNCTDNTSASTQPTAWNITVDRTKPLIITHYPDGDFIPVGTVTFNFTVTDNLDGNLTCNLSIDGVVSATNNNFAAANGSITNVTETGILDGNHTWTITCWDNASNTNTSESKNFTVDGPPILNLISPANNTHSQENVTFVYYVRDSSGITNCSLYFDGVYNQSNSTPVINSSNNNFTLNDIPVGLHNWTVNCTDGGGQSSQPTPRNITIDMTAPTVTALTPNGTTFDTNDIEFNFTVTDDYSSTFTCNVSVDGGNYSNTTTASSGANSVTIQSIPDGLHYWNVTCYDEANNIGYSNTLNFTIDAAPQVTLDLPIDGYGDTDGNITFTVEIWDDNLTNCSLIINNDINYTKTAAQLPNVNTGSTDNFSLNNTPQGAYNWTVNCTDIHGFVGTDTVRDFYVDWGYPNITLHEPGNDTNESYSTISFNFTAFDAIDPILECNVSVYGPVNLSQLVNATANQPTVVNISGFVSGNYSWNVTCTDNSNLENYSDTWVFEVISYPSVELQSPDNASTDGDGDITFLFLAQDLEGLSFCDLYIDGAYNQTKTTAGGLNNGATSNFSVTGLTEGNHTWYVNCTDTDSNIKVSDTWTIYVDLTDPNVTLHYPDGDAIADSSVTFNWIAYDNMDLNLSCNLTVNGTVYPDIPSLNNSVTNYTVSNLDDGFYLWNVTCADNGGRDNISSTYNFTIQDPPEVHLGDPEDNYRNNTENVTLYFTPTDNSGSIQNCTLILNGANNDTIGPFSEGVQKNFSLYNLTHGTYTWDVNCTDPSGNYAINGTAKTFYVDFMGPNITLNVPTPAQTFNDNNITFNWTPIDFAGSTITCNLSVSDPLGERKINDTSGTSGDYFTTYVANLSVGIHYWNVTCSDDLGNSNISETRNFTVNQPDLYINNTMIYFNNSNPDLNENITIFANVTNIGGNTATDLFVEFWDGLPDVGTYLGNDTRTVGVSATVTFNVSWNITSGYHNIWVVVDPDNAIGELIETNNNATKNISVLSSTIYGPGNNSWTATADTEINFTLIDYTSGEINYTIFVDGVSNATGSTTDNVSTVDTVTFSAEGNHSIVVQAEDDLGRAKNSTIIYVLYDATEPSPNIETLNGTFFNDTTPQLTFNITDNLASVLNYAIFVDGIPNGQNGSVNESISTNINISALAEGEHNITIQGTDQAGNSANGSIIIFIDLTKPTIILTYPVNNENFTTTTDVSLNFTVTDNLDAVLTCNLTLDGSVNRTNFNVTNGSTSSTNLSGMSEGVHEWSVTCWDGRDQDNILNINTSETRNFSIFIAPVITGLIPPNETWTNNPSVTFYFNVSDDTGLENCSILLNGSVNDTKTTAELTNGGQNNFTVNGMNGTYAWAIMCVDNTTQYMTTTTSNRTIYVDLEAPQPSITTSDGSWFNTGSPLINFTITDNMDPTLNYTIYVNGTSNATGTASNGVPSSDNLQNLHNGTYVVWIEAYDNATNTQNSSNITIYVDTVLPTISLTAPPNNDTINSSTITFNWTADDNMASILNCTLYIDNQENESVLVSAGSWVNVTVTGIDPGVHWWNVTCRDLAGNNNWSETWNFTIPMPDLIITSGNITFSNESAREGDNITINATVFNIGYTDAGNFTVQFYRGDPDSGGVQINGNKTVDNLTAGANITVSINYTTVLGRNNVFVLVDTPLAINGSIAEADETNNKDNNSFGVILYHIAAGNTTDFLRITNNVSRILFEWDILNLTGSNVFVTDSDSTITWDSLEAIGRNTSQDATSDDFEEIDTAFNSTDFPDSINYTYTSGGSPKNTRAFTVFSSSITDVPIINSTNTSNFVTGILWDYNDGGSEYSGTQDLVFITEINENKPGKYGTYDFEISIPAPLREYTGGGATVSFYTEIK